MCNERYPDTTDEPLLAGANGRRLRESLERSVGELEQELADNAIVGHTGPAARVLPDSSDSELLLALAIDIEAPESGYAFAAETAERVREIARTLDRKVMRLPIAQALAALAFAIASGATDLEIGADFDNDSQAITSEAQLPEFLEHLRTAGSDGVSTDGVD